MGFRSVIAMLALTAGGGAQAAPPPTVAKPQPTAPTITAIEAPVPPTIQPAPTKTRAPIPLPYTPEDSNDRYGILPSPDGTTLHLVGSFRDGIAAELNTALSENPKIRKVVLSSFGGSLLEGRAVEKIIRRQGLDTHVELICASACTLAYMGGTNRSIAPTARLGFHQATQAVFGFAMPVPDTEKSAANRALRGFMQGHSLSAGFIEQTLATDGQDLWYPEHSALKDEQIITVAASPAVSGIAPVGSWTKAEAMEKEQFSSPLWQQVRIELPKAYRIAVGTAWIRTAVKQGKLTPVQSARYALITALLKDADSLPDAVVDQFISSEAAYWSAKIDVTNSYCVGQFTRCFPVAMPDDAAQMAAQDAILLRMVAVKPAKVKPDLERSRIAEAQLLDFWAEMLASGEFDSHGVMRNFSREPASYLNALIKMPLARRVEIYRNLAVTMLHPPASPFDLPKPAMPNGS